MWPVLLSFSRSSLGQNVVQNNDNKVEWNMEWWNGIQTDFLEQHQEGKRDSEKKDAGSRCVCMSFSTSKISRMNGKQREKNSCDGQL